MSIQDIIRKLTYKKHLCVKESQRLFEQMMRERMSHEEMATVLISLAEKGETAEEILGAIIALRKSMIPVNVTADVIDTCGTGGDGKGTFNISTTAAFVIAGAGVNVAKHGNRKASSLCGSADVLEALGVNIGVSAVDAERVLKKTGMVFLFAPLYHPAIKHIALVRKALGTRTIFNFIGPFCNPARTRFQIVGVSDHAFHRRLADVVSQLGYERIALVSNDDGIDEISLTGKSRVTEIHGEKVKKYVIHPQDYGMKYAQVNDYIGGDPNENAKIMTHILHGDRGPKRDVILLNAAIALVISGKVIDIQTGISLAEKSIDSGKAFGSLVRLIKISNQYENNF